MLKPKESKSKVKDNNSLFNNSEDDDESSLLTQQGTDNLFRRFKDSDKTEYGEVINPLGPMYPVQPNLQNRYSINKNGSTTSSLTISSAEIVDADYNMPSSQCLLKAKSIESSTSTKFNSSQNSDQWSFLVLGDENSSTKTSHEILEENKNTSKNQVIVAARIFSSLILCPVNLITRQIRRWERQRDNNDEFDQTKSWFSTKISSLLNIFKVSKYTLPQYSIKIDHSKSKIVTLYKSRGGLIFLIVIFISLLMALHLIHSSFAMKQLSHEVSLLLSESRSLTHELQDEVDRVYQQDEIVNNTMNTIKRAFSNSSIHDSSHLLFPLLEDLSPGRFNMFWTSNISNSLAQAKESIKSSDARQILISVEVRMLLHKLEPFRKRVSRALRLIKSYQPRVIYYIDPEEIVELGAISKATDILLTRMSQGLDKLINDSIEEHVTMNMVH